MSFGQPGDGSLSQTVEKRLLMPGGAATPGVAPELFPCIVLENDRPEYVFLGGGGLYARAGSVAAGGAGTRSSAQLVNPSRSTLLVVRRILATVASGNVVVRMTNYPDGSLPFGTSVLGSARDTRQRLSSGAPGQSSGTIITDNTLATVGTPAMLDEPTSVNLEADFVLGPGGALYLSPNADNVAISRFSIFWYERRLNPSERL